MLAQQRCRHTGPKHFIHRTFKDNSRRFCLQCCDCGTAVRYNNKIWISIRDIPSDVTIYPYREAS